MFAVILSALRWRSAQALMLVVLAAFGSAAAAAAPWYALSVASQAATTEVAAAPASQRVLSAASTATTAGDPRATVRAFGKSMGELLPIRGAAGIAGLRTSVILPRGGAAPATIPLAYRDGFCPQVRLRGTCPTRPGEVAISSDAARRLSLSVGQVLRVRAPATGAAAPQPLRVVAAYDPVDPSAAYWATKVFGANGSLDPVFTTVDTFRDPLLPPPSLGYDVEVPANLLRGDDGYDLNAVVRDARPALRAARIELSDPTGGLLDRIRGERAAILRGVLTALGPAVALCWFAVALAGRYTIRDRQVDAGLLKLRGSTLPAMVRLAAGQHLVPLAAGAVAGLVTGFFAAWSLARALPVPAEVGLASALSVAAVGVVTAGGLLMLTVMDAAVLRLPVVALLRQVSSRRRRRRADLVDLLLVTVAAGAVYQARASAPDDGLGTVAPALVALVVAVVIARLLWWGADRAGAAAVRRGRLQFGLAAVHLSRQFGAARVYALIALTVAMFALTVGGYAAGRTQRAERSEVELGADRVLTVAAATRTQLEYAVRKADPGGRQAMAAVVDLNSNPPVLAVDSARLAAVATWRPEYGSATALAATPPAPLPMVTGTALVLRVRSDRPDPSELQAVLQNEATGAATQATFRAIRRGEQTVRAPVTGCDSGPGCRLIRWQLATPTDDGGAVTIRSLAQRDPPGPVLDAAALADAARWHTDFTGAALRVTASTAGLSMAPTSRPDVVAGDKVFVMDTALPVPIVLAGPRPAEWVFAEPSSPRLGPADIPVRVAGTARVLPVLGARGIMVDLDASRRTSGDAELGGTSQVWLAPGAPSSLVRTLQEQGLRVTKDKSAAGRADELAHQGAVLGSQFALLTVVAGLLLAAALVAVITTVERESYAAQLQTLRIQGLPRAAAITAGYAGTAALVVAGVLGGLVAALIARAVAGVTAPPFADGWNVIPPPGVLGAAALSVTAGVFLAVLAAAGWLSVRPLIRRLRAGAR
jgi:hypothetical protein